MNLPFGAVPLKPNVARVGTVFDVFDQSILFTYTSILITSPSSFIKKRIKIAPII
jgi:hypothetical protein